MDATPTIRLTALIGMLLLSLFWAWTAFAGRPIARAPGILIPSEPVQIMLKEPASMVFKGATITFQARFELDARVILKTEYNDSSGFLGPVDLALGWGPMSDSKFLDQLIVEQADRFYFFGAKDHWPLPPENIGYYTSNMHMIPSNLVIERQLRALRPGNIVRIKGFLVNVSGTLVWNTSLTRTDAGSGACELVWVESLQVK